MKVLVSGGCILIIWNSLLAINMVGQGRTILAMEMGGRLTLLMQSLFRTTLLKGASVRRARNRYNWRETNETSMSHLHHSDMSGLQSGVALSLPSPGDGCTGPLILAPSEPPFSACVERPPPVAVQRATKGIILHSHTHLHVFAQLAR